MSSAVVAVDEVQGNVLHSYGTKFAYAAYLRCVVRDGMAAEAVRLIGKLSDTEVTFGRPPKTASADAHVNLAFTHAGLEALKVPTAVLEQFPKEFTEGARKRARELMDTWQDTEGFRDAHILMSVLARSPEALSARLEQLDRCFEDAYEPLALVECQEAGLLTHGEREHFGFADGRSQPAIDGVDLDPTGDGIYATVTAPTRAGRALTGLGVRNAPRRWRLSRTGEFLLGYDNEDGEQPKGPGAPLGPTARSWSTARWSSTSTPSTASSRRRRRRPGSIRARSGPRSSAAGRTARRSRARPSRTS